jgi:glutamate/tyrosine decarboxylase-like PLP-dependent enzyme
MNERLPAKGVPWPELKRELEEAKSADCPWTHGMFGLWWPNPSPEMLRISNEAFEMFSHGSLLYAPWVGSIRKIETELEGMVQEMLRAPAGAATTLTSGGTESNFLAVKTARDWARENRPEAKRPAIVAPRTVHPTINKAADFLGLEVIRVPPGPDFRADVKAMAQAITSNTVMIVGSAPPYTHGQVDPVPALAELAALHRLWLHVDACVGGFLAPGLRKLGRPVPEFDFSVPGVFSVSADLHKFAYCLLGISSFTLRDRAHVAHQRFEFSDWPYGTYRSKTFAGSRPAGIAAAAWALMRHLGQEGYLSIARGILRTTELFVSGIRSIRGLELLAEPEMGILNVVSRDVDMIAVADAMTARGWPVARFEDPRPAIHLLMDRVDDESVIRDFLEQLAAAVDDVRAGRVKRTATGLGYEAPSAEATDRKKAVDG